MVEKKSFSRITLALDIIRKLTHGAYQGYHELHIIKHQINLFDHITVQPSINTRIVCDNPHVPVDQSNLCWKVVDKIKQTCNIKENVIITIQKNIPVQGGLAGGSANAATVLALLNTLWDLRLTIQQLCQLGRQIGMDVPYYFIGHTAFDTEAGGILESIETALAFDFVLLLPRKGVSTPLAYKNIDYATIGCMKEKTEQMRHAFVAHDREGVTGGLHNDFENSVFKHYPELASLKKSLLDAGCVNAVLSGSGSTLVGIARDKEHASWVKQRIPACCMNVSTIS